MLKFLRITLPPPLLLSIIACAGGPGEARSFVGTWTGRCDITTGDPVYFDLSLEVDESSASEFEGDLVATYVSVDEWTGRAFAEVETDTVRLDSDLSSPDYSYGLTMFFDGDYDTEGEITGECGYNSYSGGTFTLTLE